MLLSNDELKNMTIEEMEEYLEELKKRVSEYEKNLKKNQDASSIIKDAGTDNSGKRKKRLSRDKICVFNEAENIQDPKAVEPDENTIIISNVGNKTGKESVELPEKPIIYDMPEEWKVCSYCGGPYREVDKRLVRKELGVYDDELTLANIYSRGYVCDKCKMKGNAVHVYEIDIPCKLLKDSYVSPSLIAYIIKMKYEDGISLERQEKIFKKKGIYISKEVMANWIIKTTDKWLKPIYKMMKKKLLLSDVIYADETDVLKLDKEGKQVQSKSKMRVYSLGVRSRRPLHIFEYKEDENVDTSKELLKKFRGCLVTDKTEEFSFIKGAVKCSSWDSLRNRWHKAIPKGADKKTSIAAVGYKFCDRLIDLERRYAHFKDDERMYNRRYKAEMIVDEYYLWIKSIKSRNDSIIDDIVSYSLSHEKYLREFINHGEVDIHYDYSGKVIESFVPGKKAWVFSDTSKGIKTSSALYSIIETVKANNIDPYAYISTVLSDMCEIGKNISNQELKCFMPWNSAFREYINKRTE